MASGVFGNKQDMGPAAPAGRHLRRKGLRMQRIAVVTGASSGLGRELVRQIDAGRAGDVDEIWAVARRAERLEALVRTTRTPVRPLCLDLTDPVSFDIIEGTAAEAGVEVALLANNAGCGTFGDLAGQDPSAPGRMVALNARAPVELIYRLLPRMRPGSGILNVASVAAFLPQPRLAVYAATKRLVLDLSRALSVELEGTGISVTCVCPRFMETEFLDGAGDAGTARRMRAAVGSERVEDVARAALRAVRAGRALCIPSPSMRALYVAARLAPYRAAVAAERLLGVL